MDHHVSLIGHSYRNCNSSTKRAKTTYSLGMYHCEIGIVLVYLSLKV
jgi:hypothetical protein